MKHLLGMIFIVFGLVLVSTELKATPPTAPEFALTDQFGELHKLEFPRQKVTILVVADRRGSDQLKDWIQPIYGKYRDRIDISGVADLKPVPAKLRKLVQSSFKKQSDYPILLDWSGTVCEAFRYTPKKANLYLIDHNGNVLLHFIGAATREAHEQIIQATDKLLP